MPSPRLPSTLKPMARSSPRQSGTPGSAAAFEGPGSPAVRLADLADKDKQRIALIVRQFTEACRQREELTREVETLRGRLARTEVAATRRSETREELKRLSAANEELSAICAKQRRQLLAQSAQAAETRDRYEAMVSAMRCLEIKLDQSKRSIKKLRYHLDLARSLRRKEGQMEQGAQPGRDRGPVEPQQPRWCCPRYGEQPPEGPGQAAPGGPPPQSPLQDQTVPQMTRQGQAASRWTLPPSPTRPQDCPPNTDGGAAAPDASGTHGGVPAWPTGGVPLGCRCCSQAAGIVLPACTCLHPAAAAAAAPSWHPAAEVTDAAGVRWGQAVAGTAERQGLGAVERRMAARTSIATQTDIPSPGRRGSAGERSGRVSHSCQTRENTTPAEVARPSRTNAAVQVSSPDRAAAKSLPARDPRSSPGRQSSSPRRLSLARSPTASPGGRRRTPPVRIQSPRAGRSPDGPARRRPAAGRGGRQASPQTVEDWMLARLFFSGRSPPRAIRNRIGWPAVMM